MLASDTLQSELTYHRNFFLLQLPAPAVPVPWNMRKQQQGGSHHTCLVTLAIVVVTVILLFLTQSLNVSIVSLIRIYMQACLLRSRPSKVQAMASELVLGKLIQLLQSILQADMSVCRPVCQAPPDIWTQGVPTRLGSIALSFGAVTH